MDFQSYFLLEQMTTGKYTDMCKALHDWLEEKKINSLISIIDNMIRKFHISLEEACEVTGVSEETYQRSRRVPRLTDWIRRAVNAWGMDIGSEKLVSFSDR